MSDDLITRSFLEIEKYLTLNEKDYENTPALDSEEIENLLEEEIEELPTKEIKVEKFEKSCRTFSS